MEEVLTTSTPAALLDELRMRHVVVAAAEVEELEGVYAWALAHPALGDTDVLSRDEFPGGEGAPGVAAFTAEPLAGALGISPYAAQAMLADTLDLVHRLPRTWDQTRALMLPVWKARKIVKATRHLPLEAVAWVDRQLLGAAASIGSAALERLIDLAVAGVDPEGQQDREAEARSKWDVTLEHPRRWAGTSELRATGDTDGVGVRRVKALVSLAREGADQLAFGFTAAGQAASKVDAGAVATHGTGRTSPRQALKLYVHTSLADLAALAGDSTDTAAAEVERLDPITSQLLKSWLDRTRVTVTPVLDLADAPWDPDDPDGPTGECGTTPDNLAPLCRRHHRAKTQGRWRYEAQPDPFAEPVGDRAEPRRSRPPEHLWIGPHGETFLVTGGRTLEVGPGEAHPATLAPDGSGLRLTPDCWALTLRSLVLRPAGSAAA